MANASKRRNVGGTTSLSMLWHRMYMFIKSAITELSGATIVRSWDITVELGNGTLCVYKGYGGFMGRGTEGMKTW